MENMRSSSAKSSTFNGAVFRPAEEVNKIDKAGSASAFGRSVKRIESGNVLILEADRKRTRDFGSYSVDELVFSYIPFKVGGSEFNCIDGNRQDLQLYEQMSQQKGPVKFRVIFGGHDLTLEPEEKVQKRLLNCVERGLFDVLYGYKNNYIYPFGYLFEWVIDAVGYQKPEGMPTCHEFAAYVAEGITCTPIKAAVDLIDPFRPIDSFVCLGLYDGTAIVHTFVHINNNVCFSKIGEGEIYFHTIEDVMSLYTKKSGGKLYCVKYKYMKESSGYIGSIVRSIGQYVSSCFS